MKSKLILFAFCLITPALLHASGPTTPLAKEMELMSKSMRQLGQQVKDPSKREASLKLIQSIQKNAAASRDLVPAKAQELQPAQKAQFIADYQRAMDKLVSQLEQLSEATRQGKTEDVKKILAGLGAAKKDGHEKFSSEE